MKKPVFKSLSDIQPADRSLVGEKAFNCARLLQAGFPVPDGVVITGESAELDRWLAELPAGTLLAVRSSAAEEDSPEHSFAGIHETKLNVQPGDVTEAVRFCLASATSEAALAYRSARNLDVNQVRMAVLIQRMIRPIASGVAFTVNPISGSADEMLINSAFGLGDALVSGKADPDEFKVRKADGENLSTRIAGTSASLSTEQVAELSAILQRIEAHFGKPQDVEWCHDGRAFWIVQSRPVTTRPASSKKDIEWTRANLREVLPDLTSPMSLYSIRETIELAQRKFYGSLVATESELGRMTEVFCGRLYFNVDQFRCICNRTGTPPAVVLRAVGHEGDIDPADELVQRRSLTEIVRTLPGLLRLVSRQLTVRKRVREQLARTNAFLAELKSRNPADLSDKELWDENRKWRPRVLEEMDLVFTFGAIAGYETLLRGICKRVKMPYERLVHTYLAAGEKSVSSQQAFDLLRLVQTARKNGSDLSSEAFRSQFAVFLQKYGHRGRYESDVAMPRYLDDPSLLLFTIQSHLESDRQEDPDEIIKRQEMEAASAWEEFESKLSAAQRFMLVPRTRWLLRRVKQFYVWRELIRSELLRLFLPLRRAHLEMAARFVQRGWIDSKEDYFYLTLSDVDAAVDNPETVQSLRSTIERRKREREQFAKIDMPLLFRESQLPAITRKLYQPASHVGNRSELRGLCVSAGYAEAEVIVMLDPSEFARMKKGAILVAPATDPSWTPLFTLASGVIVEIGGMLSHASTVAREYGLPALANVKNATKLLKDGDRVRLDATAGIVQVL
jgi:rifampicin phosphotransferase